MLGTGLWSKPFPLKKERERSSEYKGMEKREGRDEEERRNADKQKERQIERAGASIVSHTARQITGARISRRGDSVEINNLREENYSERDRE